MSLCLSVSLLPSVGSVVKNLVHDGTATGSVDGVFKVWNCDFGVDPVRGLVPTHVLCLNWHRLWTTDQLGMIGRFVIVRRQAGEDESEQESANDSLEQEAKQDV